MNWSEAGGKLVRIADTLLNTGVLVPLPGKGAERSTMPPMYQPVPVENSQNSAATPNEHATDGQA